jgi:hypothetical protein
MNTHELYPEKDHSSNTALAISYWILRAVSCGAVARKSRAVSIRERTNSLSPLRHDPRVLAHQHLLGVWPASVQEFTLAYCTQGQPRTFRSQHPRRVTTPDLSVLAAGRLCRRCARFCSLSLRSHPSSNRLFGPTPSNSSSRLRLRRGFPDGRPTLLSGRDNGPSARGTEFPFRLRLCWRDFRRVPSLLPRRRPSLALCFRDAGAGGGGKLSALPYCGLCTGGPVGRRTISHCP